MQTISSKVGLASSQTWTVNSGAALTVSGVISDFGGGYSLTSAGSGLLTLTAANTYTGGTIISGGTLSIGNGGATGSVLGNITDNANLAFNLSGAATFAYGISGTGSLTKLANNTLTLSGSNSYSGGTVLSAGQINVNNPYALGSGTLTLAGGNLDNTSGVPVILANNIAQAWDASFTFGGTSPLNLGTGPVTLAGSSTATVNNSSTLTIGSLGGSGTLTKAGNGTLTLVGASNLTGNVNLNAGTMILNGPSNTINGNLTVNAGVLTVNTGNNNISGIVTYNGGSTTLSVGLLASPTNIQYGSSLVLNGGNVTFTTIAGSNLGANATFTTPITVLAGGGEFEPNTTTTQSIASNINLGGPFGIGDPNSSALYPGVITVAQSAAGTPALVAPFDQSGSDGTGSLTLSGNIVDGAGSFKNPLILRCSGNATWSISGTGNTYGGGTVVDFTGAIQHDEPQNYCIVSVAANSSLGTGNLTILPGGRIQLAGSGNLAAGATVNLIGNSTAAASIEVSYNGLPSFTANSSGVLALGSGLVYTAVTDEAALGNGKMFIGSASLGYGSETFATLSSSSGTLLPGVNNVYRLGGWAGDQALNNASALTVTALLTDRTLAANGAVPGPSSLQIDSGDRVERQQLRRDPEQHGQQL